MHLGKGIMRALFIHRPSPPPTLSDADHDRLVQAAYKGDLPQLRHLAQEKPSFAHAMYSAIVHEDGWNVLMLSTLFCHMEVIKWLITGCASKENDEETEEAAGNEVEEASSDVAVAHQIAQMINQQDREGITAAFLAAYHDHRSLLALLLAHGADPNKQHKDGLSPLGVAIYRGHLQLVREVLLPHPRLDIDARDDAGGRTALFQAAYWGRTEALQLLLRDTREGGGGADPTVLTKMATCAVQVARIKGHKGCVMLLEEWERTFLLHKLRCIHDAALAREVSTAAYSSFSALATIAGSLPSPSFTLSGTASGNASEGAIPRLQMHMAGDETKGLLEVKRDTNTGMNYAFTALVLGMVVAELKGDLFGELQEYMGRTCGWIEE